MINKIKEFFNKKTEEAEDNSHSVLNIATAALLIEVMTIDGNMDQEEMDSVKSNLSTILKSSAKATCHSAVIKSNFCCNSKLALISLVN